MLKFVDIDRDHPDMCTYPDGKRGTVQGAVHQGYHLRVGSKKKPTAEQVEKAAAQAATDKAVTAYSDVIYALPEAKGREVAASRLVLRGWRNPLPAETLASLLRGLPIEDGTEASVSADDLHTRAQRIGEIQANLSKSGAAPAPADDAEQQARAKRLAELKANIAPRKR